MPNNTKKPTSSHSLQHAQDSMPRYQNKPPAQPPKPVPQNKKI